MHQHIVTEGEQRLDKWLNIACLFKTRARATKACDDRRVKVNGDVAKPAKMIKSGDELTIKSKGGKFTNYKVLGLAHKNVPAKDARTMYEKEEFELTDEQKELLDIYKQSVKPARRKYKGRPTKKERRELEKFKRQS